MKKSVWIILLVAVALVVAGGAVMAIGLILGGDLTAGAYTSVSHSPAGDFTAVYVKGSSAGLYIRPVGEDGITTTTVIADERENLTYDVEVRDGALYVTIRDTRRWYEHIGIYWGNFPTVTLYLPAQAYEVLSVSQQSGSMEGDLSGFTFEHFEAKTGSGRIRLGNLQGGYVGVRTESGGLRLLNATADTLEARATSGRIELSGIKASTALLVKASSGAIHITDATAPQIGAVASSGRVALVNVIAAEALDVQTGSGAIRLDACDGGTVTLSAGSGNIRGTLLTEKCFNATSRSGSIHVPPFVQDAPLCVVHTGSGSIKLEVLS